MKKVLLSIFTIVFIAACLVPGLGMFVTGPSPAAGNEAAVRAPSITEPDGSVNIDFLSDAANWFSRSFALRREMITADSALKADVFGTSSQSLVALGRDGWLYYAETMDDCAGADELTQREAFCAARSLKLAQDYAGFLGAEMVFTIAPNKASVYPEHLPGNVRPVETGYMYPLLEELSAQEVNYLDLLAPLCRETARTGEQLYFTTDSHWNNRGAALAHDLLLERLGLDGDAFDKLGQYLPTHTGDLYDVLYPVGDELDMEFQFDEPLDFEYSRPIRGVDDLRIETASDSENGGLLMFRDSFGNALHSLMAEDFSQAIFSRAMPYNMGLAAEIGAEYIVVEIVERNLPMLAQGNFLVAAEPVPAGEFDVPEPCGVEADIQIEPTNLSQSEDYQLVTGHVDHPCDPDSPIWLARELEDGLPNYIYEAQPIADGDRVAFSACMISPDEDLHVLFMWNGQLMMAGGGADGT